MVDSHKENCAMNVSFADIINKTSLKDMIKVEPPELSALSQNKPVRKNEKNLRTAFINALNAQIAFATTSTMPAEKVKGKKAQWYKIVEADGITGFYTHLYAGTTIFDKNRYVGTTFNDLIAWYKKNIEIAENGELDSLLEKSHNAAKKKRAENKQKKLKTAPESSDSE